MAIKPILEKWESTMTDRERFVNQMHYKPIDRCFNMEFGYWDENFKQWDLFIDHGITNNEDADLFFNFDKLAVIGGKCDIHPAFPDEIIEDRPNSVVMRNGDGLIAEVTKGSASIPHYMASSIVTPEDWQKVKEERFNRDHPDRILDIAKLKALHPADRTYPLGVDCGSMIGRVRDMLTFEGIAYAMFDYPEMLEDMVETRCLLVEDFLDQVLPHFDFDFASGWEDICFKNGPIVTVDFFKEVVMPRYKRIHKKLTAAGIDLWYTDCDGDVRPILPYLMEGGINCLFPYEVNSCAHPAELLAEYGKDLRIMGGVDKIEMIKGKAEIKAYLETLAPIVARGGYIPFCDHRCPPDVSVENYLYYLDLKKEMFGLRG
jgi:uroporphyrinogen decarboxylase